MDITPFRLLLLDAAGAVLLADGPSGKILTELPLPAGLAPVDMAVLPAAGIGLVTLAGSGGTGALCRFSLARPRLERLPLSLPHPAQLAVASDGATVYLADTAGSLYAIRLASLSLEAWERPADCGPCVGLAAAENHLWAAWEYGDGGLLTAYGSAGPQGQPYRLGGVPTGLVRDRRGRLLVPFTASAFSGEGLVVLDPGAGGPMVVCTLLCSRCAAGQRLFPAHAAAFGDIAYVACEDSASVAIVDLATGLAAGAICLGHSVSRLAVIAGGRFAVATSNASTELALIDLVNRRPLAFTASGRELLSPLAVLEH
jgi:hypothetical protein